MKATIRVLLDPVANPKRDKRKNGLQGLAEFPAGRYAVDEGGGYVCRINQARYRDGMSVYDNRAGVEAIIANSNEVVPHGIEELCLTFDHSPRALLGILLLNGTITADNIQQASSQLDEDEGLYDRI